MFSGLAARNGGRAGLGALIAIVLVGAGLRFDYAWQGRAPVFDAVAYARIAESLDQGRGFTAGRHATQPSDNYSPGLPLFVAGVYELFGIHERLARVLLALIGTTSVPFTYLIGRRLCGPAAGLVGAATVAIYPALLEYQGMLMGEPLAAALLSAAVLSLLWAADFDGSRLMPRGRGGGSGMSDTSPHRLPSGQRGRRTRWLAPGVLLGATAMVRPEYLAVIFLVALVVFARDGKLEWRRSFAQAAVLLAGAVLVVAPWTIRNAIALGRFVPLSTGGGQVLFAGTYLASGGDPQKVGEAVLQRDPSLRRALGAQYLPPHAAPTLSAVLARVRLEQILAALAAQRYPSLESDGALSRMGREQLWSDITEQPVQYAGFLAAKVGDIWSHGPREVMREPLWEALHWALIAFGLLGMIVLFRQKRRWEALLLATIFLAITAISGLLVASPRRVLVLIPLVAALAGVGAVWTWSWARPPGRPSRG